MNRSLKGLLLKDLLNLSHYKRTIILLIGFLFILGFSQQNLFSVIPIMITTMIGMIGLATFSYDEQAKADKYILSLPNSRKQVVKAKYILIILLTLGGAILSFGISCLLSYFLQKEIPNFLSIFISCLGGILGISLIESIQIPSVFKWGSERGRIHMFLLVIFVFAVIGILAILASKQGLSIPSIPNLENIVLPILLLLPVLIYSISYRISLKIYQKKEI